jgi:hypothetical protein
MSILVWRIWEINIRRGSLSGKYGIPWYPGEIQYAACDRRVSPPGPPGSPFIGLHRSSDAPAVHCTCGIYGYKNEFVPQRLPWFTRFTVRTHIEVIGIAEVWGKIIVAEYGYRAQYAQMRALVGNQKIAQDFGVPYLPSIVYAQHEYFKTKGR